MNRLAVLPLLFLAGGPALLRADAIYFDLFSGPLLQDWNNPGLISAHDDWSTVPSVIGYRGDGLASTGTSPFSILAAGTGSPVDVLANQTNTSSSTGGVAEFDRLADPTVALQGSGTASAPFLLFHLSSLFVDEVHVSYQLRDLDGSADNAVQGVALQYRFGFTGEFLPVLDGFTSDATAGPSLSGLVTPVSVSLPPAAAGLPQLQLRFITADATGSDEWVGVDNIVITGRRHAPPAATVPEAFAGVWVAAPLLALLAAARRRERITR